MSLAVAGVSLLVAGFGAAKFAIPAVESWSDGKELVLGSVVVLLVLLAFLAGQVLARRPVVESA
jgi:hypothetical protein